MFKTDRSLPYSRHLTASPYSESANLEYTAYLFFKIHSNMILPPTPGIPFRFTNKIIRTSLFASISFKCSAHLILGHLSNIWREVPDMKLQIMSFQYLPSSCFISLFSQSSLLNTPFYIALSLWVVCVTVYIFKITKGKTQWFGTEC